MSKHARGFYTTAQPWQLIRCVTCASCGRRRLVEADEDRHDCPRPECDGAAQTGTPLYPRTQAVNLLAYGEAR